MGNSLNDQLLKAGLVDEKKAKRSYKQKRQQEKLRRKGQAVADDETRQRAQRQAEEQAARDRELNRQRKAEADQRAIAAQIRQLIESNRQSADPAEIPYNFTDGNTVKRIHVDERLQRQLTRGQLAIVRFDDGYALVPKPVAEKIRQRDAGNVVLLNQPQQHADGDDPYADYPIPDDLMW